jgi:hypothetical protein
VPLPFALQDLSNRYEGAATDAYTRLYTDEDSPLSDAFASIHERLNGLLLFLNTKIDRGGHYNADPSRELLALIEEIRDLRSSLAREGITLVTRPDYARTLEECAAFLVYSGGSTIPEDFKKVELERYQPVFSTGGAVVKEKSTGAPRPELKMIGEGSFAIVYKYKDPDYGFMVAQKVAKKGITGRDLERFRGEFELLKSLSFPYIVEAYAYDDGRQSYTMEFCDATLYDYVQENNSKLTWIVRRRLALHFLYGVNFLHRKGILHRDISRRNVLVKKYDLGAVVVKLSDFGLHKAPDSDFTKLDSSMKGTIVDPTLESFKDFAVVNDIYAVGHVLSFIFSGRSNLGACTGAVQKVIEKCTDNDVRRRYATVLDVIADVEGLQDPSGDVAARGGTPA